MKKKAIRFLTNELSPKEREDFQQLLLTDADFSADFEFQQKVFEKLERVRLHHKIQLLVEQDRLRRQRRRKTLVNLTGGVVILVAWATWQYLGDRLIPPVVPASQPHLLPTIPARVPLPTIKSQDTIQSVEPKQSNPVKKAPKQGLQPPPLKPDSYAYMEIDAPIVGSSAEVTLDTILLKRDAIILVQQKVLKARLEKKYKQLLPTKTNSVLTDYYTGKNLQYIGDEGRFCQDLSWLLKALYNIEKELPESAAYCLNKISSESDFYNEKLFCVELLQLSEKNMNRQLLELFAQDSFSLFHEKAKTILKPN